ncbi:MAG: hypothetical protein ACI9J3_002493 [Parvicellaceae bacterium]|jgi:hypothetical protein
MNQLNEGLASDYMKNNLDQKRVLKRGFASG